jgi:hypothetical protein
VAVIFLAASNVLPLSQRVDFARPINIKPQSIDDFFAIYQDVKYTIRPIRISVFDRLELDQAVNYNPKHFSITQSLGLTQTTSKVPQQSLQDFLALSQQARIVLYEIVTDVLALTQTVGYTRGLNSILNLVDTVAYTINRVIEVDDFLELTQGVSVYKENNPNFVANAPPVTPAFSNVTLTSTTTSIELTVPEFNDEDNIEHHRISRQTRSGELIVFKDSLWPVIETLTYEFKGLSQAQGKALLAFLNDTLGQTITMVDFRGEVWNVRITNPDANLTQNDGADCEGFSIKLDFEGTPA